MSQKAKSILKIIHSQICQIHLKHSFANLPIKVAHCVTPCILPRERTPVFSPTVSRKKPKGRRRRRSKRKSRRHESLSRRLYNVHIHMHTQIHAAMREGNEVGERGGQRRFPLFPVSGLSHRGSYGVSAGGWAVSTYYKLAARRPPSLT